MNFNIPAGTKVSDGERSGVVVKARNHPWCITVRWEDGTKESVHIDDVMFP